MSHESPGRETPETGNALASQASSSLLLWLTLAAVAIAPMIMYGAGYGVANGEGAAVALLCIVVVLGLGGVAGNFQPVLKELAQHQFGIDQVLRAAQGDEAHPQRRGFRTV